MKRISWRLLTVPEVATLLGLGRSTVYAWAKSGRIPAIRIGPRWRFHPEILEAWILARGTGETPEASAAPGVISHRPPRP